MILPVILAGGNGTRLWPLSREQFPKQFLTISNDSSMLQQTFERLTGIDHSSPLVICNEEHRFIAAEQIRAKDYAHSGILLEPIGRNTAPAIALAALKALNDDEANDPILLVLAADHVISDEGAFHKAVLAATPLAESGKLVTFGIVPTAPETGYGYIRTGSHACDSSTAFEVDGFIEKPNFDTAKKYVSDPRYLWNSGMFMFKASAFLKELSLFRPDIAKACNDSYSVLSSDMDFLRIDEDSFSQCPSDSIDYAVMEKTSHAVVVPMDAGWSDIGSWTALWDITSKDQDDNVKLGDVISVNSYGNYLQSTNKLLTTVGVSNLIVVETKDAVLVANKDNAQQIKEVVAQLKDKERSEYKLHREVYRPWGKYDSIDAGSRDQVKRITVKPGEKLSIQMHHHRAEHWIVVSGTAKVTNGDQTIMVTEDQSTYIPLGTIHALENPGMIPLEMIEVQTGSYLGEDDIVRFEDRYGRVKTG